MAVLVLVVVSDGDTRRHGDTDTGHRHGESHLSHVSFVSLQADSQTHGTRTRAHSLMRCNCSICSVDEVLRMFMSPFQFVLYNSMHALR